MNAYSAYACIWIAVSGAVGLGLYFTNDTGCLWALIIPGLISLKRSDND